MNARYLYLFRFHSTFGINMASWKKSRAKPKPRKTKRRSEKEMSGKKKEQIGAVAGTAGLILVPPVGVAVLAGTGMHYYERKKHHRK